MSCNCKKSKCKKCYPQQEECIDLDVSNCVTPCPNGVTGTDCVFYNIENVGQDLKFLGVRSTTSLTRVLQLIDRYLSNTGSVNLAGINWYEFNEDEEDLSKLYNVIQFISDTLNYINERVDLNGAAISGILGNIATINTLINTINQPQLSSAKVNVNITDTLKEVLQSILTYLENLPAPIINNYNVDVDVSQQQGNKIQILPDGIYVPDTSALTILEEICNTPALTAKFKDMVNNAGLKHKFFISNSSNNAIQVEYVSIQGNTMTTSVPALEGVEITDVKFIKTNPTNTLTITYKGNV